MPNLGWPLGQSIAKVEINPPEWFDTTKHENEPRRLRILFSYYRKSRRYFRFAIAERNDRQHNFPTFSWLLSSFYPSVKTAGLLSYGIDADLYPSFCQRAIELNNSLVFYKIVEPLGVDVIVFPIFVLNTENHCFTLEKLV
jgi:hypothetical protein